MILTLLYYTVKPTEILIVVYAEHRRWISRAPVLLAILAVFVLDGAGCAGRWVDDVIEEFAFHFLTFQSHCQADLTE